MEQETGLSKDVLRAWEKRYGFPAPIRDAQGDRLYPPDQIRRLIMLRTLIDLGERPGKLAAQNDAQLAQRIAQLRSAQTPANTPTPQDAQVLTRLVKLVARNDGATLAAHLTAQILRRGIENFAIDIAAPLCGEIGLAWERGEIGVYQEHLFSQTLARCLRLTIDRMASAQSSAPKVLLTTAPGEIHELGLLMVEAILRAQDMPCLNLGTQMPLPDIITAAQSFGCRVVALSFSSWFDPRRAESTLIALRDSLPPAIDLWAGGGNAALRRPLPAGITTFQRLQDIAPATAPLRHPLPSPQNALGKN